jgi:hypothetical protein
MDTPALFTKQVTSCMMEERRTETQAYGYNDWATPSSSSTRKRHEYVIDMYFTRKEFWTCKHCGAKKEDPKAGDYCDNTNDDFDTGGR